MPTHDMTEPLITAKVVGAAGAERLLKKKHMHENVTGRVWIRTKMYEVCVHVHVCVDAFLNVNQ